MTPSSLASGRNPSFRNPGSTSSIFSRRDLAASLPKRWSSCSRSLSASYSWNIPRSFVHSFFLPPSLKRWRNIRPVQGPILSSPLNPSSSSLLNIDVLDAIVITVLLNSESDGGHTDSLTGEPTDALQHEHLVGVIGECFVLATSVGEGGGGGVERGRGPRSELDG